MLRLIGPGQHLKATRHRVPERNPGGDELPQHGTVLGEEGPHGDEVGVVKVGHAPDQPGLAPHHVRQVHGDETLAQPGQHDRTAPRPQGAHRRHGSNALSTTRSPTTRPVTSAPACSTQPDTSWPSTIGAHRPVPG